MSRLTARALFLVTTLFVATPHIADAQLGGLIKKKVKEAIKPAEKPAAKPADPAPASTAAPTGTAVANTGSNGLPTVAGDVLVISPETIARAIRGLDSEASLVADFQKVLAKYPTREAFAMCQSSVGQTQEAQKILAPMMNAGPNTTAEQSRAMIEKMNIEMEALLKKKCPYNPDDWTDYKRSERMKQIHAKAASMARGKPVSSTTSSHIIGQPSLLFEVNPFEAFADSVADTVIVVTGVGGLSPREYSLLIERMVEYCQLKKLMDVSPKKGGLKTQGSGAQIFWVYREDELEALKGLDCDAFVKKYEKAFGPRAQ
jgi:hypothetical protein